MARLSKVKSPKSLVEFTEKNIPGLVAEEGKQFTRFYDHSPSNGPAVDGLYLMVTANGCRTFYYDKPRGHTEASKKPIRLHQWRRNMGTLQAARDKAREYTRQYELGVDVYEQLKIKQSAPTLKEWFDTYISTPTKGGNERSAKTEKEYRRQFKANFENEPEFKDVQITQIRKEHVRAWLARFPITVDEDTGKKHGIIIRNRCLVLLKALFQYAVREHLIPADKNPTLSESPVTETPRDIALTKEQLPRFLKACEQEETGDYFLCLLYTAQRSRREVLPMKWADLTDLDGEQVFCRVTLKGNREELACISKECAAILKKRKESAGLSPYVFPRKDDPKTHMPFPQRAWDRILEAAGLDNFRPHDLRHTNSSLQHNELRTPTEVVGKALNQKTSKITKRYITPDLQRAWESVNGVSQLIKELSAPQTA